MDCFKVLKTTSGPHFPGLSWPYGGTSTPTTPTCRGNNAPSIPSPVMHKCPSSRHQHSKHVLGAALFKGRHSGSSGEGPFQGAAGGTPTWPFIPGSQSSYKSKQQKARAVAARLKHPSIPIAITTQPRKRCSASPLQTGPVIALCWYESHLNRT
ncbi:hypothetical protein KIL84_007997 [Mauremys mutica]|uniref:Uncharacterized protein n=1 Tax=Mauremys mutica TaxID=74926 RepID=A0A9D4AW59_9SAUR|nr:hypothetical protein KIL84_007997 [Mauremys mutica]